MTARQYGILGTILLHNIILLILLFTFMSLHKPAPSEGGILINFGDVESAGGPAEPRMNESPASPPQAAPQSTAENEEGILT